MNKKGFTLVELMVSIALLSIVLIFMMNTLVKLRDTSTAEGDVTNLITGQAIISNTINSDIIKNNGISTSIGTTSYQINSSIILKYTTNVYRKISIESHIINSETKYTLKYIDCNDSNCTDEKELLLNKTLPDGFKFSGMDTYTSGNLKKITIKVQKVENDNTNGKYNVEILDYQNS